MCQRLRSIKSSECKQAEIAVRARMYAAARRTGVKQRETIDCVGWARRARGGTGLSQWNHLKHASHLQEKSGI